MIALTIKALVPVVLLPALFLHSQVIAPTPTICLYVPGRAF
ncbi:hypothetical protein AB0H18_34540 [Streptomyces sp. NPDC020766]